MKDEHSVRFYFGNPNGLQIKKFGGEFREYITQKTLINLINRILHYQSFPHKLKDTQKIQLCKNTMLVLKESNKTLNIMFLSSNGSMLANIQN